MKWVVKLPYLISLDNEISYPNDLSCDYIVKSCAWKRSWTQNEGEGSKYWFIFFLLYIIQVQYHISFKAEWVLWFEMPCWASPLHKICYVHIWEPPVHLHKSVRSLLTSVEMHSCLLGQICGCSLWSPDTTECLFFPLKCWNESVRYRWRSN